MINCTERGLGGGGLAFLWADVVLADGIAKMKFLNIHKTCSAKQSTRCLDRSIPSVLLHI
jgi:hypothetical protein